MSYSAHRPGSLDSQGRISFETGDPTGDQDPLDFLREYEPTGSSPEDDAATRPVQVEQEADAAAPTGDTVATSEAPAPAPRPPCPARAPPAP